MWKDPRTPVSVTQVGKFRVTIYDQAIYDASLREYDEPDRPTGKSNTVSQFLKQKPAARWNWTKKLEQPIGGIAR